MRALKERSGVVSGLDVVATSPPSMNVVVRAGRALINESAVALASDTTVAISTPDPTYDRLDLITLKPDGTVGYYVGTAEAKVALDPNDPKTFIKPSPPPTPANEVALAEVYVPAGATSISTIIDRRIFWQTVILLDALSLAPLTSDPSLASGKIWFRSDLGLLSYSPDGATVRRVPYGTIDVDSHADRHRPGGADQLFDQSLNKADSPTFAGLTSTADIVVSKPVPGINLKGAEAGAKNLIIRENSGVTEIYDVGAATVVMTLESHAARHKPGGADQLFDQSLNTTDSVKFAKVSVGDVEFKNGWRMVEDDRYGVILVSPEGRRYRLCLEEV